MLWNRRKSTGTSPQPHARLIGVDLNASRLAAVTASGGHAKTIALTEATTELPLAVNLDTKLVGSMAACRRTPHLVCSGFLNQLGVARQWRGPRIVHTAESALLASFEALRKALAPIGTQLALTLPDYLKPGQVKAVLDLAAKAGLTLSGSATGALAIAAHRAETILAPKAQASVEKPEWVVPLRSPPPGPGVAVIVDVDESCLFATAVQVTETETKLLASAAWPRTSLKLWKDRLLDALSDRCVRLCRRDPRDSAEAEQGLYDQLEKAMEQSSRGHAVTLTARADRWYQDLSLTPADLEAATATLTALAISDVRELITSLSLPVPPRSIWLSAVASTLPGLAASLHEQSPEGTDVAVLPREAAAEAAAALDARIRSGGLTAGHHDAVIPAVPRAAKAAMPRTTVS